MDGATGQIEAFTCTCTCTYTSVYTEAGEGLLYRHALCMLEEHYTFVTQWAIVVVVMIL